MREFGDKMDSLMKSLSISVTKITLLNPIASLSFIIELKGAGSENMTVVNVKCNLRRSFPIS